MAVFFSTAGGGPSYSDRVFAQTDAIDMCSIRRANADLPLYLAGIKKLPRRRPDYVGLGNENEAMGYVAASISIWRKTGGAVEKPLLRVEVPQRSSCIGRATM